MQTKFTLLLLLLTLFLSACKGDADSITPTQSLSDIQTAVIQSITAQALLLPPTSTATPSPTTIPSPTSILKVPAYATATTVTYSSAVGCNNSAYVSDVTIPDGTVLAPGESFTKTWKFYNSGTCAWSADYTITFASGNDMSGETTTLVESVSSGDTVNISVAMAAPDTEGTYTGYWQLTNAAGTLFGQSVYVQIVVSENAATSTPTETATSTSEDTSTPEPTSTPTPTTIPTAVPTETPTPVPTETPTSTPEETATPQS
jgi:hypothetical protein